jgi:hypothetical protein
VIALALPKWRDDAQSWPTAHCLTPRWSYFHADDATFNAEYLAQLNRFGFGKVLGELQGIARAHGAQTLVLICHEVKRARCHRDLAARWLAAGLGEPVDEVDAPAPMHAAPAGTLVQVRFTPAGRVYTYDCPDRVAVGDTVLTPKGVPLVVEAVGSDYAGPFATARRITNGETK